MFKKLIQKRLENYVRKYFKNHSDVKLIVVTGSVGKTSTKIAIATVLSQTLRVRMENTNHNTTMSAPLAMLGIEYPEKVHSVLAWLTVFRAARKRIKKPSDIDVIVQELGTDTIGEIAHFGTYLRPAIAVVTAVAPEHMEFFESLENVAKEELSVANYSDLVLINRDDIDGKFANLLTNPNIDTYGTTSAAEYRFETSDSTPEDGYYGSVIAPELPEELPMHINVLGEHSIRPVMAAVAVALKCGLIAQTVVTGVETIRPVAGRMNVLRGMQDSLIIDDTYNSSPSAAAAALQTLYSINAPQRIAILGDMNELGSSTIYEHEYLGTLCDPGLLAWVITVGEQSRRYLAPKARARGCQVKSFDTALAAGAFAHSVLEKNSVVLAKGSQGGIYLEEAIKIMLHETHEDHELVRQSPAWMKTKNEFFQTYQP